jgi:N-acyl-D-amino-acid deacylase
LGRRSSDRDAELADRLLAGDRRRPRPRRRRARRPVSLCQHPYDWATNPLHFLLPTWLHEGGVSATLERLADPYVRSRIRQKIAEVGFNNFGQIDSWADIRIAISPRGAAEPGRTIEEIARERRCDPLDAVCDVIISDKGATRILVRSMSDADVRAIAADPSALVGSDGPCVAPYGITGQGKPHPRLYGVPAAHRPLCP